MAGKSKRLINRSPIRLGESLPSHLDHLASINHYMPVTVLYGHIRDLASAPYELFLRTSKSAVFQAISDLSGNDLSALYQASIHSFAQVVTPPDKALDYFKLGSDKLPRLSDDTKQNDFQPDHQAKYCPFCLREDQYHRIQWWPVAISACIKHKCLLVGSCNKCKNRVSTAAVSQGICRSCGSLLADSEAISLTDDLHGLMTQEIVQSWLLDRKVTKHLSSVPTTNVRVLYRLLDGFRFSAMIAGEDWPYQHTLPQLEESLRTDARTRMSPSESYRLYATASKALIDWPKGFYEFLDSSYQRPNQEQASGVKRLGRVYTNWVMRHWIGSDFAFVREAFNDYLSSHASPLPSIFLTNLYREKHSTLEDKLDYVNISQASEILGMHPLKVQQIVEDGYLEKYSGEHKGVLLIREQVKKLNKELNSALTRATVENRLGIITSKMLRDLVAEGLLSPIGKKGFLARRFRSSDIELFQQVLNESATFIPNRNAKAISVFNAAKGGGIIGIGSAQLLTYILGCKLKAYKVVPQIDRLDQIFLLPSDLTDLFTYIRQMNDWMTFDEVKSYLGVGAHKLRYWISQNRIRVIRQHGTSRYFSKRAIRQFKSRRLASNQVAENLESVYS